MIAEKDAWNTTNPDNFASLAHARIKELWIVCEWYSKRAGKYANGFKLRADILKVLMEDKRHKINLISGWCAAIISLIGAAASWYAALHSRQDAQAVSTPNSIPQVIQPYTQQTTGKKSETKPAPDTLAPTVQLKEKAPEQSEVQKETFSPPAETKETKWYAKRAEAI